MKRFLGLVALFVVIVGLAGCGLFPGGRAGQEAEATQTAVAGQATSSPAAEQPTAEPAALESIKAPEPVPTTAQPAATVPPATSVPPTPTVAVPTDTPVPTPTAQPTAVSVPPTATTSKASAPSATPAAAVPTTAPKAGASAMPANWPKTSAEAAKLFGATADRWEVNPAGGWHLRESGDPALIKPSGFLGEGYVDTKPGKDPDAFVFTIPIAVQGCTIWPTEGTATNAKALQANMDVPVWEDGSKHPVRVVS